MGIMRVTGQHFIITNTHLDEWASNRKLQTNNQATCTMWKHLAIVISKVTVYDDLLTNAYLHTMMLFCTVAHCLAHGIGLDAQSGSQSVRERQKKARTASLPLPTRFNS